MSGPDNLLRSILDGIPDPAFPAIGHMPGFARHFNDRQLVELVAWMRQRYAPDRPPWPDLPAAVARARARRAMRRHGPRHRRAMTPA